MPETLPPIHGFPRLVVRGADAAISFVQRALGGTLLDRHADQDGRVVFSNLTLGDLSVSLVEEVPEWGWLSPMSLGGSSVLIQLDYPDCDAVGRQMVAQGGEEVIAIQDRPYSKREGRFRDPFGHLWILSQELTH